MPGSIAFLFSLLAFLLLSSTAAAGPCDPGSNEIVCENSKPGNPAAEWDVTGAGEHSIQGFATTISVDQARTVRFKVDTPATDYRLDIYRMGYYGGDGARKVATVQPTATLPQTQPACANDAPTGLIDCGNWAESASWFVPADATSGIYFAKLVREDGPPGSSHVVFVVRDDDGASDLLFQTSDTTWQAYNRYGGNSLYTGSPDGRSYKVSYNRPFITRDYAPEDWVFNAEYPMVRWLEANGYDVSYFTGVDTHARGAELLEHRSFLSVGHDEYWSGPQHTAVRVARRDGVHLAFFSGNEVFWKTRFENANRTLVSYKETHANAKIDPTSAWTGTWRDPRSFNPEGGRPENSLTGTIFTVNCCTYAIEVPADDGKMRFWRDTSVASLPPGAKATLGSETLGYEWDEDLDNGSRPAGVTRLSTTSVNVPQRLLDHGSNYGPGTATHHMTYYRWPEGGLVFGAGTVQWAWGLDGVHDRGAPAPDQRMRQATVNLLADMGSQPLTLQPGLVGATASLDVTAPGSQVTAPVSGTTVELGEPVTITGTATDSGGGRVGGVEVSVDGGATWHPAAGRETWSYSWTPQTAGAVTLMSRAVDDSARLEVPGPGVPVTVEDTPPPPPPDEGPGGPVLVVGSAANPFSRYYAEILRAEGLNAYEVKDITSVTAAVLAEHDVVILGEMPLNAAQVTMLTQWVQGGGNLIAMRPDDQLAGLLGLTDTGTTLAQGYLHVDTSGSPGEGIAGDTMQYHGVADRYTATSASTVATLYSNETTATSNPAVTLRSVGSNGGQAAAFTYDLARSVVYTRQGNPAWAGQERDGQAPIRADDLFFGAAAGDNQPDWVNLDKVAIPQADEQQRLLVNLIGHVNADRKPLPRFWFLPRSEKAAIVMTGDDHGGGGTAGRFEQYKSFGPPGCSVAAWECVRGTSYVYTNTSLSNTEAAGYHADGFEVGLHVDTNCANWTKPQLEGFYSSQLSAFGSKYTSIPAPRSSRTHCIAWSDWASQAEVELANGIRLDTNYYYWPPAWIQNRPGMFTGSGSPMRFAKLDGSLIDVYQAATQLTDESGQVYPQHVDTLLNRATGTQGYYGVFTANIHTDNALAGDSDSIVTSARARGVPIVSGRQMLTWLDGRNSSAFDSLEWNGSTLTFTIDRAAGATGLRAMVPTEFEGGALALVKRDGDEIPTTAQTIKGVEYAFFEANDGSYEAVYDDGSSSASGLTDTTVSHFGAGTPDANTYVSQTGNGEVTLKPQVGAEFSGAALPLGWTVNPWSGGGSGAVSGGFLTLDEASAGPDQTFGAGRAVEFATTFGATNQHVGFGQTFNELVWAIFSVKLDGNLYARTANDQGTTDTLLPASLVGTPHRFRIEWLANSVEFFVDDELVAVHATSFGGTQMRPLASDLNTLGTSLAIDWMRMSPYPGAGTFVSRVLDAGTTANWGDLTWLAELAPETDVTIEVRIGNTPTPGPTWSAFAPVGTSGDDVAGTSRYIQYRATLTSSKTTLTPALQNVNVAFEEGIDDEPPTVVAKTPGAGDTDQSRDASVEVQFSEPMNAAMIDESTVRLRAQDATFDVPAVVSHSGGVATLDPDTALAADTDWVVTVDGNLEDQHGNAMGGDETWTFETEPPPLSTFRDNTPADFGAGDTGGGTYVSEHAGGEVLLSPTEGSEFGGAALPSGWTPSPWDPQGTAVVAGGKLTVDGAMVGTDATYGPGRALEFVATFGAATFQHAGFSDGFQSAFAIFSTFNTSDKLYARTSTGGNTEIPGSFIGSEHRYRIEWGAAEVKFYIDGDLVDTHPVALGTTMWPAISDFSSGGPTLEVDWARMTPYESPGTFTSRVFDAGAAVDWGALSWNADAPAGTSLQLSVRTGNTVVPDGTWTAFEPLASSGGDIPGTARYVQYRAQLATGDPESTPVLYYVRLAFQQGASSSYVRPKSAPTARFPLVIAFTRCTDPGLLHGPPLVHSSCADPVQRSPRVTAGTPDANGAAAAGSGSARLKVQIGNPFTSENEADAAFFVSIADVRRTGTLADYTGQLRATVRTRMTDRLNGPSENESGTVADFDLAATVPCTATAGVAGATCMLSTSANALVAGSIVEGKRTVRELGQFRLFDGGSDDLAATDPNSVFAVGGFFVP